MKSTELALLIECCRCSFDNAAESRIPELARRADWNELVTLARRHRVQGLVWQTLNRMEIPTGESAHALRADSATIAENNLRAAAHSAQLLEAFDQAGAPLLFVKGLTLGTLAYSNPFLKMSSDIDILVPPDGAKGSADVLRTLGYRLIEPASGTVEAWHDRRKESVWSLPGRFQLDLHTRLADSPWLIPTITVDSPRQQVEVAPGITLPTLAVDELVAYLAVHGAWASWFRLKWMTDFAGLVARRGTGDIDRLYRRSIELGAGRAAAQALLVAEHVYRIGVGAPLLAELRRDRANRFLAKSALAQMARPLEPTDDLVGTLRIHLAQFFLRPGMGFKASEFARQTRDAAENRR